LKKKNEQTSFRGGTGCRKKERDVTEDSEEKNGTHVEEHDKIVCLSVTPTQSNRQTQKEENFNISINM
tara:strand:+ start:908 stop:1111 length:204 start_codon:yes stop_codon:yes gene_type:complete